MPATPHRKSSAPALRRVQFTCPEHLHRRLKVLAIECDITPGALIAQIVEAAVQSAGIKLPRDVATQLGGGR